MASILFVSTSALSDVSYELMKLSGYLAVLTAALLWASSGTIGKHLFASGILLGETFSPVQILGGLLIIGAIAMLQIGRERAEST